MRRPSIWLLVIGTACLSTLALVGTTCWLFATGETDAAKESAALATGTLAATLALLARQPDAPQVELTSLERTTTEEFTTA